MKYTDEFIKQYLDGQGTPWDQYFLAASKVPAYRDSNGRLMALLIEDDPLYMAVKAFLVRMGKVEALG